MDDNIHVAWEPDVLPPEAEAGWDSDVLPPEVEAGWDSDVPSDASVPANTEPAPERKAQRLSVHVYGGKGALCFEPDMTRGGAHTIALDAALASGPRQYDWQRKIRVQLTQAELPVVACVLLGWIPRCEYRNHGPDNNKGFSLENQTGRVFVRVFAKAVGVRAVPVEPADIYKITTLCLRQLQKNSPWLSGMDIMHALRATIAGRQS